MSSIDEKRVHGANTEPTALFVASDIGLTRVAVAGERVGEIELRDRRPARDCAFDKKLAVATEEDVLVGESLDESGFGPATAVGFDDEPVATAPDGTVARRIDDDWHEVGTVETVHAIDGDLLGTDGGVYRITDGGLQYTGLDAVRDVATTGVPRAATATGLYRLGNGWLDDLDGEFTMVSADAERAHAATMDDFYAHEGEWQPIEVRKSVAAVAYAEKVYAVTRDGTLLVETDDGWRDHPLGVGEPHALVAADRKPV
ncbi:HVO_0234 family beta-propeller protein [Halococcus sp. AFM35]|uniref:HVO_0234 family beta-propeller protein n=1 Tax=Halococcus sp. AFM35 TaxID=3421653 RepID=UPI003EB7B9C3